jgi:4-hydroxybenzoate polyprenyltransferase
VEDPVDRDRDGVGAVAAMAFNRVVDDRIDARNARTASRHLPAGLLSRTFAWSFVSYFVIRVLAAGR